jgi:hypothetical protein
MEILDIISLVADIIAILGIPFTAWRLGAAMWEKHRLDQTVTVKIVNGQKEYPLTMQRRDVTRGELLGRIGMTQGEKRFAIRHLNTSDFLQNVKNIYEGGKRHSVLMIPVTDDEYRQFQFDVFEAKG